MQDKVMISHLSDYICHYLSSDIITTADDTLLEWTETEDMNPLSFFAIEKEGNKYVSKRDILC